jgi:hypothetical protein
MSFSGDPFRNTAGAPSDGGLSDDELESVIGGQVLPPPTTTTTTSGASAGGKAGSDTPPVVSDPL